MLIHFDSIEETIIPNMRGGEKQYNVRMFNDGMNKIMKGRLVPGASIGLHTHEADSETMYFLEGTGKLLYDNEEPIALAPGACHYCPKGHSHSVINDSDADLIFFAIVPVHG